jgi:hypothetical protein
MTDGKKSREELLEEMQALRNQLAELDASQPAIPADGSPDSPSRRGLLKWVAPVVLTSTVLPNTLYAQGLGPPTGGGTSPAPTIGLTFPPTAAPPTRSTL